MKLLFVKGNKGSLAAIEDGKFYFPDRKSNITQEGVYECHVTVEKDTYAFVDGKLIETHIPSEEYIHTIIKEELFDSGAYTFQAKNIGASIVVFHVNYNMVEFGYIDDYDRYIFISSYNYYDRRSVNTRGLYTVSKFTDSIDYESEKTKMLDKDILPLTEENIMKAAVSSVCNLYSWKDTKSIIVYDNKFVVIETENKYLGLGKKTYAYIQEYGMVDISTLNINNFNNKTATIHLNDVETWMINNHVLNISLGSDVLFTKTISFMGNNIDVLCINGGNIMEDISDEDKKRVERSFEELEAFRKKVGKNAFKDTVKEMIKLSPKHILNLQ